MIRAAETEMGETATTDTPVQKFAEFFYKDRHKYLRFALRFVHNPTIVEDLVNDSFAKFWEKRDSIPADTNVDAYFYTIVKHNCLNYLRDKESQCRIQSKILDTSYRLLQYDIATLENYDPNLIFTSEIKTILQQQLDKMPELTRMIFMDNRFNDMSYDQIAQKYNVPVWKVTREIQSAISSLRVSLRDYLPAGLILWACTTYLQD